jgi:hypothetical protein
MSASLFLCLNLRWLFCTQAKLHRVQTTRWKIISKRVENPVQYFSISSLSSGLAHVLLTGQLSNSQTLSLPSQSATHTHTKLSQRESGVQLSFLAHHRATKHVPKIGAHTKIKRKVPSTLIFGPLFQAAAAAPICCSRIP